MKRQRTRAFGLLIIALLLATLRPAYVAAATTAVTGGTNGPLCNSGGYFTPASVTVASGDTITFSVPADDPYAGGIQINGFPQGSFVVPRGGSVTTDALTADVSYQGTWPSALSCIKGSGTITVQAASSSSSSTSGTASSSSTQTPAPSTSTTTPTSTKHTTTYKSTTSTPAATTSPASAAQPAVPETVVADTIAVAGKKVTSIQDLTISESQPLILSGTTVPNGKITLTIHSNPTTAAVQADATGKWSYTVTGLQPGLHTINATVTDPATNQTSASSKLLSFTVAAPATPATVARPTKNHSAIWFGLATAGALLLIVVAAALKMRKRRAPSSPSTLDPLAPPETGTATLDTRAPADPAAKNTNDKEDER